MRVNTLLALSLILLLTIITASTFSDSRASSQIGGGSIKHVIIVMEENEPYSSIVNSSQAPYQNDLMKQFALAGNYFSPEHPSLPNYIDVTAGSDMGITTDCPPSPGCQIEGSNTNLADLLNSSNLSWKEYAESMPHSCYDSNSGNYAVRHNPFVYYTDITDNSTYCDTHVVPMNVTTGAGFINDLNSGNLPNFSFVTPNLCDDGHNSCSSTITQVQQIDKWLGFFVPKVLDSPEFASTALFIVYDEGSTSTVSSQVVCIVVSPFARSGYVSHVHYTHFSLLATIENIFGLGNLGKNDAAATVMTDLFVQSSAVQITNSSSTSFFHTTSSDTRQSEPILSSNSITISVIAVMTATVIAVLALVSKRYHKRLDKSKMDGG